MFVLPFLPLLFALLHGLGFGAVLALLPGEVFPLAVKELGCALGIGVRDAPGWEELQRRISQSCT